MVIAIKYAIFAVISTLLNLYFQYLSFLVYSSFGSLYVAMLIGTLAGLISKYVLDKKFIYYHKNKNKKTDAKMFVAYSLTGVLTTIVFWGTEIIFDTLYQEKYAKYLGAAIGLSIGYIVKYFLDKRFVFKKEKDEKNHVDLPTKFIVSKR